MKADEPSHTIMPEFIYKINNISTSTIHVHAMQWYNNIIIHTRYERIDLFMRLRILYQVPRMYIVSE